MHALAPGVWARTLIGWRASLIRNPVARLRFLRHTVGDRRGWDPRTEYGRGCWRRRSLTVVVIFLLLLLVPAGTLTSAGRIWRRGPLDAPGGEMQPELFPQVWRVEQNPQFETYSNGLRIERRYEVTGTQRRFTIFHRGEEDSRPGEERTEPMGIVYHATESPQAEFVPQKTPLIRLYGAALLDYVRQERAYHYVVDRFGRVWRVVKEGDAANHAGYSVWADRRWTYVNVNRAFLGISVEAMSPNGEARSEATPAQVHSLRVLTEMLRAAYHISVENCVTHAQVSVNPDNMEIAYHYDWASGFPFAELGLPDNYGVALPSLWLFGFGYSPTVTGLAGSDYRKGLLLGQEQLRQAATAHGLSVTEYRHLLLKRYRQVLTLLKSEMELSKENQG